MTSKKRHDKMTQCSVPSTHCIKTSNFSLRSANLGLKFRIQVAKGLFIYEIRTISYKVKYLLKHVHCLRIFRTALVCLAAFCLYWIFVLPISTNLKKQIFHS